jgi:tRNA modification GTPase
MRRVVVHQLEGGLSRHVEQLRNRLLDLEGLLAYDIDFPEEDHGPLGRTRITDVAADVQKMLQRLLATAPSAELARDGAIVVIAGRPNVGKSSLFNALLGEQRAIVTAIPGTTRDAIEAMVQVGQWPIRLVDTAGLRQTDELVEQLGIEVSQRYLKGAHAVIACDDDVGSLMSTTYALKGLTTAPTLSVVTKVDQRNSPSASAQADQPGESTLFVSAHNRNGLSTLCAELERILEARYGAIPTDRPALTRLRQRLAVAKAVEELASFQAEWEAAILPGAIAAVHVRAAVDALDELIGAIDTEDVLGRVFATFCVGK